MITIIKNSDNSSIKYPKIDKDDNISWVIIGREVDEDTIEKGVITIESLLDFEVDFKEFLAEKKKASSYYSAYPKTQYNNSGYSYAYNNGSNAMNTYSSDSRTCYFYEYSDLSKTAKIFLTVSEFVKWAREVGVTVTDYLIDIMKENPCNYITCYKNKNYIMVRSTYTELKKANEADVIRYNDAKSYNASQHSNLPVVCGAPNNPNAPINGPLARDFTNDDYPRDYNINDRWPYDD